MQNVGKNLVSGAIFVLLIGCSSAPKIAVRPNEHMEIGWTPRSVFQSPSYAKWFDTGYVNYKPQEEYLSQLRKMKGNVSILVVYGTWCSDSRREVPRFWKVIDSCQFPPDSITMIAVDRTMLMPEGIKARYNITNVPTFIISFRGMETGRIIESPKKSLEEDLVDWLEPFFPAQ